MLTRGRDAATGRAVLADHQTTCLPKYLERFACLATAWRLARQRAKSPLRILQSPSGRGALPLAGASTLLADTLLAASLTESLLSVTRLAVVAARRA